MFFFMNTLFIFKDRCMGTKSAGHTVCQNDNVISMKFHIEHLDNNSNSLKKKLKNMFLKWIKSGLKELG